MELSCEEKISVIQSKVLHEKDNKYYSILNSTIEKYNIEHSINKNGIFLNLSTLDSSIIDDIYFRFINLEDNNEPIYTPDKVPVETTKKIKQEKKLKDKLVLDKFDKYIIQLSKSNLSI